VTKSSPTSSWSWRAASRWRLSSRLLASHRTTTCQNRRRPLPWVRQRVFDTLCPSTWRRSTPAPGLRAMSRHRSGCVPRLHESRWATLRRQAPICLHVPPRLWWTCRRGRGCRRAQAAHHPEQRRPNLRPGSHHHLRLRRPPRPCLPRLRAPQCRPRCRRKRPRRPRWRRRGHRRLRRNRHRREWIERHHAGPLAASTGTRPRARSPG
jgi:hypothetical protein